MSRIPLPDASAQRKPRGRPRRLTRDQLIEAGVALGLEQLSISSIALKLGVSVATIYTYVENLDELRRLVATVLLHRETLKDVGQPWQDVVRILAKDSFEMLSQEPHMLAQLVSGTLGPDSMFRYIETFLAQLGRRGFTVEEAFSIYRNITWISSGAAMGAAMVHSWERQGESRRQTLAYAVAETGPDEYPNLCRLGAAFHDEALHADYAFAIEGLIRQIAAARGEGPDG